MMVTNKEYIVSLNVSFITPFGISAKNESDAEAKAKTEFNNRFKEFKNKLDDIADIEISLDYIEDDE